MKVLDLAICAILLGACQAKRINTNADASNRILVLRKGKMMEISCNSSSRIEGSTAVSWFKSTAGSARMPLSASDRVKVHKYEGGGNVTIQKAILGDVGNYTCKFEGSIDGEPNVEAIIQIATNASTYIVGKSVSVKEGSDLKITCKVAGVPMPTVKWTKNHIDVRDALTNSTDRLSFSKGDSGHANAVLHLKSVVRVEDAGDYCCAASNVVGKHETCTIVRVKDKYAALWPFIGIVAEVILLTAIIYIYEKRKGKVPDLDDSDTDHPSERPTQSKGDIRQRK